MSIDPLSEFDREILSFLEAAGVPPEAAQLSVPAEREFGERGTNAAFRLARERRQAPTHIADEIASTFRSEDHHFIAAVESAGRGFINFRLNYDRFIPHVIAAIREAGPLFGRRELAVERVVVEHTSVNPNKEWHIGHVRNAVLGDVVTRVLRLAGHTVQVQNYIDDTGLQAAQAVYALLAFPEEPIPGEKFDHLAGRAYVKIAAELGAARDLEARMLTLQSSDTRSSVQESEMESARFRLENIGKLQRSVIATMHALEKGDHHDTLESIVNAQLLTAFRLGAYYDLLNWESHLVQSQTFERAMAALGTSPKVYRATEGRYAGATVIETGDDPTDGEERKCEVLIRSNGIPTYVGKDIAYHMWKFGVLPDRLRYVGYTLQPHGSELWSTALVGDEWQAPPPNWVINVIAVDQTQAQEAVKEGLRAGGFAEAADHLTHLGYGLVTTAEGRISGRKGTSVSGDSVINEAVRVALDRVREKRSQDLTDADMESIAESVGIGAIRYFMVAYNPLRDIVFDVKDVVSYDGNTGLYVQYALVRMHAILRRAQSDYSVDQSTIENADASLLQHDQEKRLIYHLVQYPELIATVSRTLAVNLLAEYAFDLATIFNGFYRDCGVLNARDDVRGARLLLVQTVRDVLVNVANLLGVPVIERL
ncbi:MAG: arginine--tRNA ligase [Chloroflexota bacterium]